MGFRDCHQITGPMLSGYATSATTTTRVAQNATPGFLLSKGIGQSEYDSASAIMTLAIPSSARTNPPSTMASVVRRLLTSSFMPGILPQAGRQVKTIVRCDFRTTDEFGAFGPG